MTHALYPGGRSPTSASWDAPVVVLVQGGDHKLPGGTIESNGKLERKAEPLARLTAASSSRVRNGFRCLSSAWMLLAVGLLNPGRRPYQGNDVP